MSGRYLVNVRRKKTVRMKSVSVITISGTNHAHARPQATGTACAPRGRPRTRARVAEGAPKPHREVDHLALMTTPPSCAVSWALLMPWNSWNRRDTSDLAQVPLE